ncbi:MAG: TetR/AcrR family transcriptional regulator [Stackebrandtia sp.]
MRLFTERGYESTTMTQIAAAADVSPMTVYRHFPTKEDLVLVDTYDELIAERIAALPADLPPARRIGQAILDSVGIIIGTGESRSDKNMLLTRLRLMIDTPALRARHLDSHYALQNAIVTAIRGETPSDPATEFRLRVTAGVCLVAMNTALVSWTAEGGRGDLIELITTALGVAFGNEFG